MEFEVKKIMTYKSGQFAFSLNYDKAVVRENLIKARSIYSSIRAIPILPQLFSQLEEELIRRSIFGTAAIEGNPLSEQEVDKILIDVGNHRNGTDYNHSGSLCKN